MFGVMYLDNKCATKTANWSRISDAVGLTKVLCHHIFHVFCFPALKPVLVVTASPDCVSSVSKAIICFL